MNNDIMHYADADNDGEFLTGTKDASLQSDPRNYFKACISYLGVFATTVFLGTVGGFAWLVSQDADLASIAKLFAATAVFSYLIGRIFVCLNKRLGVKETASEDN